MSKHRHAKQLGPLIEMASGSGGKTLIVEGSGEFFYAGLRRPPAEHLLEAVSTFLLHGKHKYEEVLVFTGTIDPVRPHLPQLDVGGRAVVGISPVSWFLLGAPMAGDGMPGRTADGAESAEAPDCDTPGRVQRRLWAIRAANRVNRERVKTVIRGGWTEALRSVLDEIDTRAGMKYEISGKYVKLTGPTHRRSAVLVDCALLKPTRPPAVQFDTGESNQYTSRFLGIPVRCSGTPLDVVFFCRSPHASQLLDGTFSHTEQRSSPSVVANSSYPDLRLPQATITLQWPGIDRDLPWGGYLPGARASATLYTSLRQLQPLASPRILRRKDAPETAPIFFDEIVGMNYAKELVKKFVNRLRHPELDVIATDLLGNNLGILLYGPPGTGKTTFARATATELGQLPFLIVDGAEIKSSLYGDSEKRLKAVFTKARSHSAAVIFIDEMESVVPNRSGGNDGGARADNALTTIFLQELDGFSRSDCRIIVIGATNKPWNIDPAGLARLEKVPVGLPDMEARIMQLNLLCKKLSDKGEGWAVAPDVDIAKIAAAFDRPNELYSGRGIEKTWRDALRDFIDDKAAGIAPDCVERRYFDSALLRADAHALNPEVLAEFDTRGWPLG